MHPFTAYTCTHDDLCQKLETICNHPAGQRSDQRRLDMTHIYDIVT